MPQPGSAARSSLPCLGRFFFARRAVPCLSRHLRGSHCLVNKGKSRMRLFWVFNLFWNIYLIGLVSTDEMSMCWQSSRNQQPQMEPTVNQISCCQLQCFGNVL